MQLTQKITTFLWFDDQAEEAANFYTSLFPDSRIVHVQHYGEAGPGEKGRVMLVTFELAGQQFHALNGGPQYRFTEAISLMVSCTDQAEVDEFWEKLGAGGEPGPCGWLKDRYGLSWQVVPDRLMEMISAPDRERAERAMSAMLQMSKIELPVLEDAWAGRG